MDNLINGHPNASDFAKKFDRKKQYAHTTKRKATLGVQGHTVVVPLYLKGIPTNMVQSKKVVNNKIVNIFICPNVSWSVTSREIVENALNLLLHVVELESQGYRTNIYAVTYNTKDNIEWFYGVKIKGDRESLNVAKMYSVIVSSSYLRRVSFKMKEVLAKDWIGSGDLS